MKLLAGRNYHRLVHSSLNSLDMFTPMNPKSSGRESVDVLHVVPAYFPARGGIEVLLENLVARIHSTLGIRSGVMACTATRDQPTSYQHQDIFVHTVPPFDIDAGHMVTSSKTIVAPNGNFSDFSQVFSRVRSILKLCQPRLVHVHGTSNATTVVPGIVRSLGIPFILHAHGTIDDHVGPAFRRTIRDAQWVCAVSRAVEKSIQHDCARTGPIRIIWNGVPDPLPTTKPYGVLSPTVAMIGRLSEEKGFDDGLRALSIVRESIPDLKILLVGDGNQHKALHDLATELGLIDSIEFYGELPHDRALRVAAGTDVILVPSKRVEGFSLIAVEAALLKRPVIGTSIGGLPETILNGETGILVPPGESEPMATAITRLLTDADLRNRLGTRARERALQEFTLDRFVGEIAALYEEILGSSGSAAC